MLYSVIPLEAHPFILQRLMPPSVRHGIASRWATLSVHSHLIDPLTLQQEIEYTLGIPARICFDPKASATRPARAKRDTTASRWTFGWR